MAPENPAGVLKAGLRDLTRIDRAAIGPTAGALRVVPVVTLFACGLAFWGAQDAVTLALGAHLIGVASTVKSARTSYSVLTLNAVGLGLATFVGSATEQVGWLHIAVLVALCLGGGLLVALGPLLGLIGTQAIIAFLVFGRFPESPSSAVRLGLLVLAGAAAETAFLSMFRWPSTFRAQREAIAAAFSALATSTTVGGSTVGAGMEFDRAATLLFPGFLGRDDERALRGIVDEGRRMRVEAAALLGLLRRLGPTTPDSPGRELDEAFEHLGLAFGAISRAVHDARHCPGIVDEASQIDQCLSRIDQRWSPAARADPLVAGAIGHFRAVSGQLRAAARLLGEHDAGHRHLNVQPLDRLRSGWEAVSGWGMTLRANLTLTSPAMRHAVRLAVTVPVADLIARAAGLPRSYWVPLTVAVVLRSDFGSLFTRGIGRVLGTSIGVTAAGFLVAGLHPDHAWTVVAVGLAAWAAYATFQANFAVGSAFIAAIVLLLLSVGQINTTTTAADRLLDTVLGGGLALGAYLVWPTWSSGQAREAIARLAESQGAYLEALVTRPVPTAHPPNPALATRARSARLAWTEAQATVARSIAEPARWRIDGEMAQSLLGGHLRIIQAAHALRSDLVAAQARGTYISPLSPLIDAIGGTLSEMASALRDNRHLVQLPPLRDAYDEVASTIGDPVVLSALDEIVDAVNTIAHLLEHSVLERVPTGHLP